MTYNDIDISRRLKIISNIKKIVKVRTPKVLLQILRKTRIFPAYANIKMTLEL